MSDTVTTKDISEEMGLSRHYVTATLVRRPDFPAPAYVLNQKTRAWDRDKFEAWRRRQRKAAGG